MEEEDKNDMTSIIYIPYEINIGLYITIIVLLTLIVYFNKEKLDVSFIKEYYMYIYI